MTRTKSPSILFLTKYSKKGASSRYRTLQYIPYFEQAGIHCVVSPLFDDAYLEYLYQHGRVSKLAVLGAFWKRLKALISCRRFDLLVIEYELFPYFPAWVEQLLARVGTTYVIDYDDALFHQYDQHKLALVRRLLEGKIAHVMRSAKLVIAGNAYLADYAENSGARHVEIVPTVVDLNRYSTPAKVKVTSSVFTIGWIGSPSTAKYLETVAPALAAICANGAGRVVLIGSGPVDFPDVPIEVLPWDEANEVYLMRQFDVGIMPLPDEPWARGKCGFKLIQYMACGLPVVASPVGVNAEIVEENVNGFLATDHLSWMRALTALRDDRELGLRMGRAGREKVKREYCLQVTAPRLTNLLQSAIGQ